MSDCTVKDTLTQAMKAAMRNRDKARLGTIRLVLAALKQIEVDEKSLDDQRALAALNKMAKQRRDAMSSLKPLGAPILLNKNKLSWTSFRNSCLSPSRKLPSSNW